MMQYPVALQTHNFLSSPASPEPSTPIPENEPKVTKITNCRILRDHKIVEKDDIWIQNGKIIDPHKFFWYQKRLPDIVLDAQGLLVVPGFIETQINGAFGVDFSVPLDHDAYEKGLLKVNRGLLKFGTTSYCPTIVSSSSSVYHQVLSHLKPRAGSVETGATVLGAHVEGPFINKARNGAHELKVLQASAPNGYKDFKDVYGFEGETPEAQRLLSEEDMHCVKIITCAPELEGIMGTIPDLVKAGITVSVGHSMANISQAEQAVTNGATFITHLFNAMPQFHHRDPGVIGLLGSRQDLPRPYYGLICDGVHVHPNSVKIAYDSHPEGVILVTDAMSAMGLAPGNYQLGNMSVTKEEDRVCIENTDILAGRALENTHTYTHTHQLSEESQYYHQHLGLHGADKTSLNQWKLDTTDRGLTKHSVTPFGHERDLSSPSDDVRFEEHSAGFLPTPPGSTPLSPLTMSPGTSEDLKHQFPLPELLYAPAQLPVIYEWTIEHYHEYEEHMVYDVCEEHEGSDHSLRIITIHIADTDDDVQEESAFFAEHAGSRDVTVHEGEGVEREVSGALKTGPVNQDSFLQPDRDQPHLNSDNNTTKTLQTKEDVQLTMSDCSCHPGNDSCDEGRGSGSDSGSHQGLVKAQTDVNYDGDLCCPSSSVITLDACVRNFIKFTHCSPVEALEAVTLHPAVLLGIQETKGVIKPGADADLVFLSEDLFVKRVFVAGEEVDLDAIDVEVIERF
ncbi:hypothetical protein BGZ98_009031 [Dissophora globulifera]|nr:hypothetical protein BGZ98_009031 [Dissophora globulifera]